VFPNGTPRLISPHLTQPNSNKPPRALPQSRRPLRQTRNDVNTLPPKQPTSTPPSTHPSPTQTPSTRTHPSRVEASSSPRATVSSSQLRVVSSSPTTEEIRLRRAQGDMEEHREGTDSSREVSGSWRVSLDRWEWARREAITISRFVRVPLFSLLQRNKGVSGLMCGLTPSS
jgi:hypothetical protein